MPINITDEALEYLDAAPKEARDSFIDGLAPEDLGALSSAIDTWRAKRPTAPTAPASFPVRDSGVPAAAQSKSALGEYADAVPYTQTFEVKDSGVAPGPRSTSRLNELKDKYVAPAFDALRDVTFRPAGAAGAKSAEINAALDMAATGQLSPEQLSTQITKLEDPKLAAQSAEHLETIANLAIPLGPLAGPGRVAAAGVTKLAQMTPVVRSLPFLGRILGTAAEGATGGAIFGAIDAATRGGQSLEEGVKTGAKFGAGLGGGLAAAGEVAQGAQFVRAVIKSMSPADQATLSREISALPAAALELEKTLIKSQPTAATMYIGPDGEPVGRIFYGTADGFGAPVDTVLATEADVAAWRRKVNDHGVDFVMDGDAARKAASKKSGMWYQHLLRERKQELAPGTQDIWLGEDAGRRAEAAWHAERKSKVPGPPDPDVPEGAATVAGRNIVQDGSAIKITPQEVEQLPATVAGRKRLQPALIGGGSGPPAAPPPKDLGPAPIEPPPPPGPGSFTADELRDLNAASDMAGKLQKAGALDRFRNQWLNARHWGTKDFMRHVRAVQAAQSFERNTQQIYATVRRTFKRVEDFAAFDRDLQKLALGRIDAREMEKYGEAWSKGRQLVDNLLAERDLLDKKIRDLGGVPENLIELRENGDVDRYMARMYLSHILPPGEWTKRAPKDVKLDALKTLADQHKKAGSNWSPEQLAHELDQIMGAEDPISAFMHSDVSKAWKNLKRREDIPETIRKAMGEVESGSYRLAVSLGNQRAIAANLEAWANIANDVRYFSPAPAPGFKQLPNNPKAYGMAAGGFVHPDVYEGLVNLPKAVNAGPSWLRALIGWSKGNEVALGGLSPQVNSAMGNILSGTLSGGFDVTNPMRTARNFRVAWRAIRDYAKDPSGRTGLGHLYLEAMKRSATWEGYSAQEIVQHKRALLKDMESTLGALPPTADARSWLSGLRSLAEKYKGVQAKMGGLLDAQDELFRLQSYFALREKAIVKAGFNLKNAPPEVLEKAADFAAYKVNRTFWNAQHTAQVVDKMRNSGAGLFAKYATPWYEDHRIWSMAAKDMLTEDPAIAWRMLAAGTVFMGLPVLARRLNGISDEEVDKAAAQYSDRFKTWKPALFALPFRGSDGKVRFVDISKWLLPLKLLSGHPDSPAHLRVLSNLIAGPFDGGAGDSVVRKWMTDVGLQQSQDPSRAPMSGEAGGFNLIAEMARADLTVPKGGVKLATDVSRMVAPTPRGPQLTLGDVAMRAAGLPVEPAPNPLGATMEQAGKIKQLEAALRYVAAMPDYELSEVERLGLHLFGQKFPSKQVLMAAIMQQIQGASGRLGEIGAAQQPARSLNTLLERLMQAPQ